MSAAGFFFACFGGSGLLSSKCNSNLELFDGEKIAL